MPFLIGILLALAVGLFGAVSRFDRDRSFYPVVTIVIASYYGLFGVMGGAFGALGLELAAFFIFAAAAVVGFRTNLWIAVAALAGHGLFDLIHPRLIANPGVPDWWPAFCLSFDLVVAACLASRLGRLGART